MNNLKVFNHSLQVNLNINIPAINLTLNIKIQDQTPFLLA